MCEVMYQEYYTGLGFLLLGVSVKVIVHHNSSSASGIPVRVFLIMKTEEVGGCSG